MSGKVFCAGGFSPDIVCSPPFPGCEGAILHNFPCICTIMIIRMFKYIIILQCKSKIKTLNIDEIVEEVYINKKCN